MASGQKPVPAAIGFASGVLLIVGALLDWSGVAYSSALDRRLAFAAGASMIALAVVALLWRPRVLALAIAAGAIGLNMGIVGYRDISGRLHEYAAYPDASVGVGLYFVIVGAALALLLGLATAAPRSWSRFVRPFERR